MAIQNRRGNEEKLDTNKLLPGEWAVTSDTKKVYMCFTPGDTKRMATYEDMQENIKEATIDVAADFTKELTQTIESANTAISSTKQATTNANYATTYANNAASNAQTLYNKLKDLDVSGLQSDINTVKSNVSSLQTDNTTNKTNITSVQNNVNNITKGNTTLAIDAMPVGFSMDWWSNTLPSNKWMFGNTSIPSTYTQARAIFGTSTPNTKGKVIVDLDGSDEFKTIKQTGGVIEQELKALIGPYDGNVSKIGYTITTKGDQPFTYGFNSAAPPELNISNSRVNDSTQVKTTNNKNATTLQPYIVARKIFKVL